MTSSPQPILLCYDRSRAAERAIEQAGALLGQRRALVLHVWRSVAPDALRQLPQDMGEVADIVIEELDASGLKLAEEIAEEGAALARRAGFTAEALLEQVAERWAGHPETNVWQAIMRVAQARDAAAVVIGSSGVSGLQSALLGSVSYGLVHNCRRPVVLFSTEADEAGTVRASRGPAE